MNIKPDPVFVPTPGVPTAAAARFPYHHPSIEVVDAALERNRIYLRAQRKSARQSDQARYERERRSARG